MAKILIGIVAALACLVTVESLDCNSCGVGLLGVCLNSDTITCSNDSICYTSEAKFPSITSFSGFNKQGCTMSSTCVNNTASSNGTLPFIGIEYNIKSQCCSTDKCNPVTLNGASTSTLSLSVLSVAALAAVWGSYM
ncbi:lymphocyte antigen 6A-2/6E-1-like [Boleophthalmus pectinirostris]|uniref:lymphocyte antigen 6A-2/6E-1-like n=1 Tax=Boleophthalmus pectinirostris TaxID=150288 RepID=UPI00242C7DED|nr:lymphocyte antigen 6A-2/6E-1-like [Boleophthalmus pectinirostris]